MNRKQFIQNSSVLLGGSVFSSGMLHDIINDQIIYGQNEKRYRLQKDWVRETLASLPINDCHEMVQDRKGRIVLLTNETKNNLIFFNKKGKAVRTEAHEFPGAHGLTKTGEGKDETFFVTDTVKNEFYKVTPDGKVVQTWGAPLETGKYTNTKEFVPTETAITIDGEIYVADGYGAQYVTHYDTKGKIKNIFGGRGEGEQYLDNAHGICIDHRSSPETLLVTDRTRCCFKRYSMQGAYIEKIELPGAFVCRPVIKGDYLYAAVLVTNAFSNANTGFVVILDKTNKPVSVICGSPASYFNGRLKSLYQTIPVFKHPHDVLVDDEDNLYVCQWNSGKVYPYKFSPV
jgi:hypothetical protein